jgi:plasmid replication initiation protein
MEVVTLENFDPKSLNGVVIRKHNDLIEAQYKITDLGEQRIIFMLLAQIQPHDEDFKAYRISVADFAKAIGLKGNSTHETLDRVSRSLVSREISIREGKSFLHTSWLSSAKYIHGSGYIDLMFDPNLKPYLLQLKDRYTQYKLDIALHFKSIYAIRLYEFFKKESFKSKNGKFNISFEYTELREIFFIDKKEYKLFGHFRTKTIEPAVREISDKSDLIVDDVRYGKTGRKVSNITFCISFRSEEETNLRNKNLRIEDIKPETSENHQIIDQLMELGFSFEVARKFKNKYTIKQIERNIAYTLAKKQEGLVKDIPAYLSKAIEEDWGGAWDIEKKKQAEKIKKHQAIEKAKAEQEEKKKQNENEYSERVIATFFALQGVQRATILQAFIKSNHITNLSKKSVQEEGEQAIITHKSTRGMLYGFLMNQGAEFDFFSLPVKETA